MIKWSEENAQMTKKCSDENAQMENNAQMKMLRLKIMLRYKCSVLKKQYGLISSAREFRTGENLFLHVFPLLLFHQSLSIFSGETFFPQVDLKALFFKDRFFSQRHGV